MIISKNALCTSMSNASFFLVFPAFFFYQSAIGKSLIPPFLGGYFGVIAIGVFPFLVYAFIYLKGRLYSNYSTIDVVFYVIMFWVVINALCHFVLGQPKGFASDMLTWSVSGALFNLVCYLLGRTISLHSRRFKYVLVLSLLIMDFIVFSNIGKSGIFYLKLNDANNEAVATYQGFARSLLMLSALSLVMVDSNWRRLFLFSMTFPALFLNGARTEFILFIAVYLMLASYQSKTVTFFAIAILGVIGGFFLGLDNLASLFPDNRMAQILDILSSTSGQERIYFFQYAINTIENNPFAGDYGGYTRLGGIGSYSHNLFSAWVNLGFMGFVLYLFAIFLALFYMCKILLDKSVALKKEQELACVFIAISLIGLVFAKDYSYMLFGFMVGAVARYLSSKNSIPYVL